MAKLVIDGFPSVEAAKSWWDWYEGQGEQDVGLWINVAAYAVLEDPKVTDDVVEVKLRWGDE